METKRINCQAGPEGHPGKACDHTPPEEPRIVAECWTCCGWTHPRRKFPRKVHGAEAIAWHRAAGHKVIDIAPPEK